ncbi:ABC transporter permease [Marinobacterium sediminicola]|uniref:Iron(III) transport system permease protein n=1 Tax=Marinobacterium sediminicola TaxID=518898 RepID=A0ABY1S0P9_9GAMM|nr:iron ABC transporter permease [Marinobacterium sediminicola]ULG68354.1 iron ABC transporter permease [Marinobacterium sediminicola]SMR74767.1 iron(III) transport system permease protein [Marinobacterium sediminicola]
MTDITATAAPLIDTRKPRRFMPGWYSVAWGSAILVMLPVLAVFWLALFPTENIWPHLVDTILPIYVKTTLLLLAGVGSLSVIIGVGTAWLVTMCNFPGRRIFEWALLLPFAMPAYLIAYLYTDLLEYAGPVQSFLRELFGWQTAQDYWFPEIRSLGGAISMLTLVLYPYVYLLSRASFLEQSMSIRDASRIFGCSPMQSFYRVSLPVARPAVAVGLSLVSMETLNDFGTVDYFAVKSLSAGIYDAWLNMGNLGAAAQIATLMLVFVIMLISLERIARSRQKQFNASDRFRSIDRYSLSPVRSALATLACALPVLLGFLIPFMVLGNYALPRLDQFTEADFLAHASHSFTLSALAALLTVAVAVILAYSKRLYPGFKSLALATRLSSLGYALPGAVLAIGVIIPLAAFDNSIDAFMREHFGFGTGLLLSGTPFAIVFAYCVRFLAVSSGSVESSLAKVTPSMDMASRSLGMNPLQTLRKVHLPLIRGGLLTALLVVFVDGMKELPATLILRPFNYDTLATYVYQYASDEMLETSALAALLIVLVGIVPVILLSRTITSTRQGE